jgi:hypothetical protein
MERRQAKVANAIDSKQAAFGLPKRKRSKEKHKVLLTREGNSGSICACSGDLELTLPASLVSEYAEINI